ncbi:MAG: hypothetical protein IKI75_00380 [Lachnospiraceae bacterium]|nr:hypothetical protein [Lachnospiraceae bacterium]
MDAASLQRLNVTRRSEHSFTPAGDHSEGPVFSEVLASLAAKHAPAALKTTEEEAAPALSEKEMRTVLKSALNSDNISDDIVSALTDSSGNVSEDLLDMIFSGSDDDEDEILSSIMDGDSSNALDKALTDIHSAKEYLSSKSGRNLIAAMAQRSLSELVS